jgi:hypothetical protein
MSKHKCAPTGVPDPALTARDYVRQELKRIPLRTRTRLSQLGLRADLEQELHLAYYQKARERPTSVALKRAIHAAGERLRYREIVRRAKYEVPEDLAGAAYHTLVYGIERPSNSSDQ